MDALHFTTTTIKDPEHKTMIDVDMSYYSQEYPEPGHKPFTVYWFDWFDFEEIESHEIGNYETREEAESVYNKIVTVADNYVKSLLRTVYSFEDYLQMNA